jgi:hypothetical protein
MKQAQSGILRPTRGSKRPSNRSSEVLFYPAYAPTGRGFREPTILSWIVQLFVGILAVLWYAITVPFRVLIWILGLLGRLTGLIFGFFLMVVGMALWAGPFFIIGIPLFIIGLLLTLRCVG